MTQDQIIARLQSQNAGGILHPMLLVRAAEFKHRKSGGNRPDCIKLSPDFYEAFMQAYRVFYNMADEAGRAQLDLERPHVLGIPIVCEDGARWDIEVHVSPGRTSHDLSPIIVP